MDNPHVSVGAGGVIAKGRWICDPGVTNLTYTLTFYLCPRVPTGGQESWPAEGCTDASPPTNGAVPGPVPGQTYTGYVPNSPAPAAHGTGYWVGANVYQSWAGTILVTYPEVDSNAVYISA
ncbi:MAG TPA: hypothetical protein VGQ42_16435 [Candidatus Dormibacteraeota bacterium]|jgi:hypothetical protein|nr:hypothetical protein [Candidatus Dormibacteraeota bacterium]